MRILLCLGGIVALASLSYSQPNTDALRQRLETAEKVAAEANAKALEAAGLSKAVEAQLKVAERLQQQAEKEVSDYRSFLYTLIGLVIATIGGSAFAYIKLRDSDRENISEDLRRRIVATLKPEVEDRLHGTLGPFYLDRASAAYERAAKCQVEMVGPIEAGRFETLQGRYEASIARSAANACKAAYYFKSVNNVLMANHALTKFESVIRAASSSALTDLKGFGVIMPQDISEMFSSLHWVESATLRATIRPFVEALRVHEETGRNLSKAERLKRIEVLPMPPDILAA